MDSARALFMILGVFYHSALIYDTTHHWRVNGIVLNYFFDYFSFFVHTFRMEGFYVVAGFFAAMLIEKKGTKKILKERLLRLGLPLLSIGFTFNYIMNYYSVNQHFDFQSLRYYLFGEWIGHLWFLGNLLLYIFLSVLLIKYKKKWLIIISRQIRKNFFIKLFLITCFFFIISLLFTKLSINKILFISFPPFFQYFPFYVLGYLFFPNKRFFDTYLTFERFKYHLLITLTSFLLFSNYLIFPIANSIFMKIFSNLLEVYFSITISLFFLILFKSFPLFNKNNPIIRKLSDASYTIYLLHQPMIIVLFVFTNPFKAPFSGFFYISFSTLFLTYLIHILLVQKFQIFSLILNGANLKTYTKSH